MLLTSHGFRDVHNMTESHAFSILNVLSGVKNRKPPPIVNAESPGVTTTRFVSSKRKNKPEAP